MDMVRDSSHARAVATAVSALVTAGCVLVTTPPPAAAQERATGNSRVHTLTVDGERTVRSRPDVAYFW